MNKNNMKNSTQKKVVTGIIAAIIAIVIFFGGMKYGEARNRTLPMNVNFQGRLQAGSFGNRPGGARGGMNGGFISGEILTKDDKSITIKLPTGGSKIVFTSGTTQVMKPVVGTLGDLSVGINVSVAGSANSDGSVTAQSIQIRPAGSFGSTTSIR